MIEHTCDYYYMYNVLDCEWGQLYLHLQCSVGTPTNAVVSANSTLMTTRDATILYLYGILYIKETN